MHDSPFPWLHLLATLGFVAHWCLFMPTNTHADARSSYLTHRDKISPQNATVICENAKPKWVWIIWMSHHSQEVWDIWPVADLCSPDVLTSSLQSCTVILRLFTSLPVCIVSEIMMHALRSAEEIGYTGQVSRAGVHHGGSQDLCLIPLKPFVPFLHSDLWKLHWEQLPQFPGHTGEYWAKTRRVLFSTKRDRHLELVRITSNLKLTGYNRHQWRKAAFVIFFQSEWRNLGRAAGRKVRLPCTIDDHTQPKFEPYTSQHHHLSCKYNIIPTKHHCWTSEFHHSHQCQLYCR